MASRKQPVEWSCSEWNTDKAKNRSWLKNKVGLRTLQKRKKSRCLSRERNSRSLCHHSCWTLHWRSSGSACRRNEERRLKTFRCVTWTRRVVARVQQSERCRIIRRVRCKASNSVCFAVPDWSEEVWFLELYFPYSIFTLHFRIMKQKPCHLQRRHRCMDNDCIYYTNECSCWRSFGAWTAQESEMLFETHLKANYYPTASELKERWFRDAGLSNFKRLVARKVLLYRTKIWLLQYNREHYIAFESQEHFEHFFLHLKESLAPFDALDVKNKK